MSSSAHLIQMFDSAIVRAHVSAAGAEGGKRGKRSDAHAAASPRKAGGCRILDNLGSHAGKRVIQAVRAVGARLVFLPKYSPDLNPIEQAFAKLKGFVRKRAPPRRMRKLRRKR
jgi:transposase